MTFKAPTTPLAEEVCKHFELLITGMTAQKHGQFADLSKNLVLTGERFTGLQNVTNVLSNDPNRTV